MLSPRSEEALCAFDALIYELRDEEAASDLYSMSVSHSELHDVLSDRMRLPSLVARGKFAEIEDIVKPNLTCEAYEAIKKTIDRQSWRWRLHNLDGAVETLIYEANLEAGSEAATYASEALLDSWNGSTEDLNRAIWEKIYANLTKSSHLTQLLNAAYKFGDLVKWGRPKASKKVSVSSFAYTTAYFTLPWPESLSPIAVLKKLVCQGEDLNPFGRKDINEAIEAFLDKCMAMDEETTLEVLSASQNKRFGDRIFGLTGWTPLGRLEVSEGFDVIAEYLKYTPNALPSTNILDVGRACAVALRRIGTDITAHDTDSEVIFPIGWEVKLDHDVWSVCSDSSGKYALFGTSEGEIYSYNFDSTEYKLLPETSKNRSPSIHEYNDDEDEDDELARKYGTERIKAHPTRPGVFAIMGGGKLTLVDLESKGNLTLTHYEVEPNSYGDVCWHPEDPDLVFYCNDSLQGYWLLRCSTDDYIDDFESKESFVAITCCGNDEVAMLSSKVLEKQQSISIVNFQTKKGFKIELPRYSSRERQGTFSTLLCSQWDHRTLMLITRPNIILLVDKKGERPTRIIFGPRQEEYMIKAVFFGPMDKYILAASEEGDSPPKAWLINRFTGDRVGYLTGHKSQVNDVAFVNNRENPVMMTGSDDHRVLFYPLQERRPFS